MVKKCLFTFVILASIILSACSTPAPTAAPVSPTEAPAAKATDVPAAAASKYSEAPMLADLVKAGSLPAIDKRLPEDVFVVGPGTYLTKEALPDWQPGVYGGTLRSAHSVANWSPDLFVAMNEPFLMAPKIGDQNIVCNICKEYKVSDDNKVFTFTLRKGLKWSDGEPVTTEDVRFTWEDIKNNEKLAPSGPDNQWRTGFSPSGNPAKLEILDDYSFKVTFDGPYGSFLRALTIEGWVGYTQVVNPSHYLKKYHIKYTSLDALKPELDKLNLTGGEWWQVFSSKRCQNWDMTNPRCADYPGLYAWVNKASGDPSLMTFERNPYYFKVDTKGQQLPYIDKMTSVQVNDVEAVNMKILAGDVDFMRESTALVKVPEYTAAEAKAGFSVHLMEMHVDSTGLRLNETFNDANWKKVAQDVRFRQAISLSINRKELIDTIYYTYAALPLKTVGEEFSTYDVAKANKILDDMGLTKKDADGFRQYEDGKTIEILLEHGAHAPDIAPVSELVAAYLKAIGIKVTVKQIDPSLWGTKWAANEIQATVMWSHDIGWGNDVTTGSVDRAGVLWSQWLNSNGKQGEEPPQWAKDAYKLDADKWAAVAGSDAYNKLVDAGFKWCRDNLPYVNFVEGVKYPMIANSKLGNVPPSGAPAYAIGANFSIVQMFFKP